MPENRKSRRTERGPGVAPSPPDAGAAARLIREARLRRSLTQAEIAERSGFDQSLISRWERGRTEPSFAAVLKVLGACGSDVWAALALAEGDRMRDQPAELNLLDEETPPDAIGFRRLYREQDAERRRLRGG